MTDQAPRTATIEEDLEAAAANAASTTVVGKAPFDSTVTAVTFSAEADITGDNTDKRVLTLVNKGQDGNGATSVAVLDFATGTNASDFDERAFALSGTPANLNLTAGDVLAVVETYAGTGLANPGGRVAISIGNR